jgi:hypothetical protein
MCGTSTITGKARHMARPKKQDKDKRTARLPAIRMTEDELADTKAKAKGIDLPLTTYAREMILKGQIIITQTEGQIDPAVFLELRRIGNNINQAVKKYHEVGTPPPILEQLAVKLDELLDALIDKLP